MKEKSDCISILLLLNTERSGDKGGKKNLNLMKNGFICTSEIQQYNIQYKFFISICALGSCKHINTIVKLSKQFEDKVINSLQVSLPAVCLYFKYIL